MLWLMNPALTKENHGWTRMHTDFFELAILFERIGR